MTTREGGSEGDCEKAASAAQAKSQERLDKVDRAVEQRTQALEEKRSWAVTGRAGRDTIGRVYDEEDPGGAGDPTIPDYVMWDYEGIRDRYRNEQEDTVTRRTAGRAQGLAY